MKEFAITTLDNPYDPFDEFDKWLVYDNALGYKTLLLLNGFAHTSEQFSDKLNNEIIEEAIDEIVEMFNGKVFKKIIREIKN